MTIQSDFRLNTSPKLDRLKLDYFHIAISFNPKVPGQHGYLHVFLQADEPYLSIYLSSYLYICLSLSLSIYLSIYLSIDPSIHPSIHPSIYISIYLSVYLSLYLSIDRYLSI